MQKLAIEILPFRTVRRELLAQDSALSVRDGKAKYCSYCGVKDGQHADGCEIAAADKAGAENEPELREPRNAHRAQDSGADIFRKALNQQGVDCRGIHDINELRVLFNFSAARRRGSNPKLAADSSLFEKFPNAARKICIL